MATTTAPGAADRQKAAIAALVAGAAFAISSLGSAAIDGLWVLMIVGFALFVYAVPTLHRYQAPSDGQLGRWGTRLVLVGGVVLVALAILFFIWDAIGTPPEDAGPIGFLWAIGFFSFVAGAVLFSGGTLRAGVFPRGAAGLMLLGILGALAIDMATGAFFNDEEQAATEWGFYVGVPLFGLGLAWLGYTLWSRRDPPERTTGGTPAAH